jgi:MraZ protein
MPGGDPSKSVLKRNLGTLSIQVKLDSAGRIALPEEMAAAAGINGQAVLVGCLDRFEIWSPERYKQVELIDQALLQKAMQLIE